MVVRNRCRGVRVAHRDQRQLPGETPGLPRTPNAGANCSSVNNPGNSRRTRIANVPFGNAARATTAVCSGISGHGRGCIDIKMPSLRPDRHHGRTAHRPRTQINTVECDQRVAELGNRVVQGSSLGCRGIMCHNRLQVSPLLVAKPCRLPWSRTGLAILERYCVQRRNSAVRPHGTSLMPRTTKRC
jgi:hypothetical protein